MGLIENHCVSKNLSVFKKIVLFKTFKKELKIGNLQDTFVITEITHHKVIVNTPNAQAPQNVSMNDFEYMHQHWNAYCNGNITRTALCQHTRVSKYTMSILRHIEIQLGIQIA